jgi:hypothetical protein
MKKYFVYDNDLTNIEIVSLEDNITPDEATDYECEYNDNWFELNDSLMQQLRSEVLKDINEEIEMKINKSKMLRKLEDE